MGNQSLHDILYILLDWRPARIRTFTDLIWGVIQARTVKIKELAIYGPVFVNTHKKIIFKKIFDFEEICWNAYMDALENFIEPRRRRNNIS